MSIILTEAQQHELAAAGDEPLRLKIQDSGREYVVISAALYDRLRQSTDELSMSQVGELVERTMREYDEGDPTLASYQKYRT